MYEANK